MLLTLALKLSIVSSSAIFNNRDFAYFIRAAKRVGIFWGCLMSPLRRKKVLLLVQNTEMVISSLMRKALLLML